MSNTELRQRIDATERLNDLARSTMDSCSNPVALLSRALEETRIFLSAEARGSVDTILDATCIGEVAR